MGSVQRKKMEGSIQMQISPEWSSEVAQVTQPGSGLSAFLSINHLSKENPGEVSFPSLHLSFPICKMRQVALPALIVWGICSQISPKLEWVSGRKVSVGAQRRLNHLTGQGHTGVKAHGKSSESPPPIPLIATV